MMRQAGLLLTTLAALALSGCAGLPGFEEDEPRRARARVEEKSHPRAERGEQKKRAERPQRVERAAPPSDQALLREGIALYHDGDFNGAIRKLGGKELDDAPLSTRTKALKYLAFSYCVTKRPAQCLAAFEKAFELDPGFELTQGERGHPLWGPVYRKAKVSR